MYKSRAGSIILFLAITLAWLTALALPVLASDAIGNRIAAPSAPVSGGYGEGIVGTAKGVFLVRCLYATSQPDFYLYTQTAGWTALNTYRLETGIFRNGTALAWDSHDYIYTLVGGRYKDSGRTTFLRYTISTDVWEHLANTPYAQGAGDAITWSGSDNKVYAIVGSKSHNGGRSSFMRYDPETDTWTVLPFLWTNTDDGAALVWTGGDYLYALRGEYMETTPNGEFARYQISTGTWEKLPSLPDPGGVGDGGSLLWDPNDPDSIFALSGGAADESYEVGFFRYSIVKNQWEKLSNIPCPIGYYVGNRLAYSNGTIYYWQGSPKSSGCGGNGFYQLETVETPPAPTLIINEVELNPPGEDSGAEWIELYNPTTHPVGLTGWSVTYTSYGGGVESLPDVTVLPKGYFVYTYTKRRLNNSSGSPIKLIAPDGTVVDATPPGLKDTYNDLRTWQRIPNDVDSDSLSDWIFKYYTPNKGNE